MQAEVDDVSMTSMSSPTIRGVFPSPSFVTNSTDASDTSSPVSELASTPLSPEVEPTSMMWSWRSFDDDDAVAGDGESFSKEIVDNGDDVIELKAFVMNIFGVKRPVSLLLLVDESGLGQIGKGDIMGEEPRLKLKRETWVSLASVEPSSRTNLSVKILL